jgi:hypothetical protein
MKAVVVGNGPSLNDHIANGDFDLLASAPVHAFGMNLIDLLYDRTEWRPTYYVWMEYVGYSRAALPRTRLETYDRVLDYHIVPKRERCFIGYRFKKDLEKRCDVRSLPRLPDFKDPTPELTWVEACATYHGVQVDSHRKPDDWHLPCPCVYGGTMNTVLSFAFMFGYSDVAVIGCDLGLVEPVGDMDLNHFDPSYHTFLDGQFEKQDGTLEHVHAIARKNFERMGRRIINAGIGGLLTSYQRMPLGEWLND